MQPQLERFLRATSAETGSNHPEAAARKLAPRLQYAEHVRRRLHDLLAHLLHIAPTLPRDCPGVRNLLLQNRSEDEHCSVDEPCRCPGKGGQARQGRGPSGGWSDHSFGDGRLWWWLWGHMRCFWGCGDCLGTAGIWPLSEGVQWWLWT